MNANTPGRTRAHVLLVVFRGAPYFRATHKGIKAKAELTFDYNVLAAAQVSRGAVVRVRASATGLTHGSGAMPVRNMDGGV